MTFPMQVQLKDGTEVMLVLKEKEDTAEMARFFANLPFEDRLYLRRDVTKQEVLEERARELEDGRVLRIAAYRGDELVGEGSLYKSSYGWSRHVGELRLVVAKDFQRKGLGSVLAREIFLQGIRLSYKIIEVFILAEDKPAIACVEKLGFTQEAIFTNHARDINDQKHELVLMTYDVDEMWEKMRDFSQAFEIHSER